MEVMALSVRLKEEGAATVEAALKKLRLSTLLTSVSIGTTLTLAVRKLISASSEAQAMQAQLGNAIRVTGGEAGQTLEALNEHAAALQNISTFGDEAINQAQARLLTYTGIVGDAFPRATEVVLDYAAAFGTDLVQASEAVGRALNYPTVGLGMLSKQGFIFTESQKAQIKYFEDTNQLAKAQAIIFEELESVTKGAAAAQRNTLGGALQALQNAWGDLFEVSRESSEGIIKAIEAITATLPKLRRGINDLFLEWGVLAADVELAMAELAKSLATSNIFIEQLRMAVLGIRNPTATLVEMMGRLGSALTAINEAEEKKLKRQIALSEAGAQAVKTEAAVGKATADTTQAVQVRVNELIQLSKLTKLTRAEYDQLVAAEKSITAQLAKGNLGIEDRIKLLEQQKELTEAIAGATVFLTDAERLRETGMRRMADAYKSVIDRIRELRKEMEKERKREAEEKKEKAIATVGISAAIPAPRELAGAFRALTESEEMQVALAQFGQQINDTLAETVENNIVDGLTSGIAAALSTGRIADAWKAMSQAIIQNLASAMVKVALAAIRFGTLMDNIRKFMVANPALAVASAAAMLAFAYANGGKAQSTDTGFTGGRGGGQIAPLASGMGTGDGTVTRLIFGQTSATTAAGMTPRQATNVTIIGPDDPKAQRAIEELIRKGQTRGTLG